MNYYTDIEASDYIDRIRSNLSESAFGYKIQAIAGHVLLRLGFEIDEINSSGHPDIIARINEQKFHFEIEAEVGAIRLRKLTDADFKSLISPGIVGYYALAVIIPTPGWILVPARKLVTRKNRCSKALLKALSDKRMSEEWTREYTNLVRGSYRQLKYSSFKILCDRALEGRNY